MKQSAITAIIVNYCTYELTRMAVWSLHGHYPGLPIHVVDNGSPDGSGNDLRQLADSLPPVQLTQNAKNLHHGPGMDQIARTVDTPYFLTFDSDAILYRPGLLEQLTDALADNHYAIGHQMLLDNRGFNTTDPSGIKYIHPFCALFRTEAYQTLPPFEKHGVPCFKNECEAQQKGWEVMAFPVQDYVYHPWQGTASHTGHNLGWRNRWRQLLHDLGI
jgi:GT2 family glycosyltransferase